MSDDVDLLWVLVSGVLMLVMATGVGVVIEGFTRRRSVSTGAGRYLATTSGAVGGAFAAAAVVTVEEGDLWVLVGTSVLLATIISGGIVERATFIAHGALGVVIGAVVVPTIEWARDQDGVLTSISVEEAGFSDASAATLFSVGGWMALVGIMVIGPRRGWLGADGRSRIIPGKSMPAAALGTLLVLAAAVGAAYNATDGWTAEILDAAGLIVLAGASGAVVSQALGWRELGAASTSTLVHGALAGVVSSLGAPLELTVVRAVVVGALGAAVAWLALRALNRAKVDDPVGIVAVFGAAGFWGSLAVADSVDRVVAQLVGLLIIAAWAVVCAGVTFGLLRVLRLLRVSPDVEVVGLEG